MILPPFLKEGDTVGIVAPARKIKQKEIKLGIDAIKSWGLNVILGKNLYGNNHQFSGTDKERAADIQEMIDHPKVRAIFCARGGYGSVRILPLINFDSLLNNPCWLIGFSDVTAFHNHLNNLKIVSLHAPMLSNFSSTKLSENSQKMLKDMLFGRTCIHEFAANPLNITGEATGQLVGGNLSVLYSLAGTKYDLNPEGKILFIEDLDEYLYHIDRMIMNFATSGKLNQIKGLIVGGMTDMNDNRVPYGKNAEEIIYEHVRELGIPIAFSFPSGHIFDNQPLLMGKNIQLSVQSEQVQVTYL